MYYVAEKYLIKQHLAANMRDYMFIRKQYLERHDTAGCSVIEGLCTVSGMALNFLHVD